MEFKYEISGINQNRKKFFEFGSIEAETPKEARELLENPKLEVGMTKLWTCIFVKKNTKTVIIEGDL
jgi:hypothetical protein